MSERPRPPRYLAERRIQSIKDERTPDSPPEPKVYFKSVGVPEEEFERLRKNVRIAAYLSYDLIEYAWLLAELSWERRGRSDEGMELPASSRACATGAIASGYAAIEAAINESIVNVTGFLQAKGETARARLVDLSIRLPLRSRLDAVAGWCPDFGGKSGAASGHSMI